MGQGVDLACAPVVTQPLPGFEYGTFTRLRQRLPGRKKEKPASVVGNDGDDLRLLQHEFRDGDGVGIAGSPPREVALRGGIPSGKALAQAINFSG